MCDNEHTKQWYTGIIFCYSLIKLQILIHEWYINNGYNMFVFPLMKVEHYEICCAKNSQMDKWSIRGRDAINVGFNVIFIASTCSYVDSNVLKKYSRDVLGTEDKFV